jgi:hypothetical protein
MTPTPTGASRRKTSLSRSRTRDRATGPRSATRHVVIAPVDKFVILTMVPNLRVRLAQESDPNGLAYQLAPPRAVPFRRVTVPRGDRVDRRERAPGRAAVGVEAPVAAAVVRVENGVAGREAAGASKDAAGGGEGAATGTAAVAGGSASAIRGPVVPEIGAPSTPVAANAPTATAATVAVSTTDWSNVGLAGAAGDACTPPGVVWPGSSAQSCTSRRITSPSSVMGSHAPGSGAAARAGDGRTAPSAYRRARASWRVVRARRVSWSAIGSASRSIGGTHPMTHSAPGRRFGVEPRQRIDGREGSAICLGVFPSRGHPIPNTSAALARVAPATTSMGSPRAAATAAPTAGT